MNSIFYSRVVYDLKLVLTRDSILLSVYGLVKVVDTCRLFKILGYVSVVFVYLFRAVISKIFLSTFPFFFYLVSFLFDYIKC